MKNNEAIKILKPFRECMVDQHGCPISDVVYALDTALAVLSNDWIPCEERMPDEKDAGILKKLGVNKRSEYVLVTVEVKGERFTDEACTYDGEWQWSKKYAFSGWKIIAWMPKPEPYKEDE